jgi:hypothetical protein
MKAIGKQGGLRRGKTAELEPLSDQERAATDIEEGMAAHRDIVRTSGNAAARSRSASELIRLARELERLRFGIGTVTVETAREQLIAKLDEIEDHRRRAGQVCEACGALLPGGVPRLS